MLKKSFIFISGLIVFFLAKTSLAVCPVCTIAVGAGVGLSRWLGIDDIITGLWVGGLLASLTGWTLNWLDKKNVKFKGRFIITAALYYILIIVPLVWADIIGHDLNKIWGIDRLIFGIIIGTIAFVASVWAYDVLKKRNDNQAYFPFQKVVMPVGTLLILSLIFYFIIK